MNNTEENFHASEKFVTFMESLTPFERKYVHDCLYFSKVFREAFEKFKAKFLSDSTDNTAEVAEKTFADRMHVDIETLKKVFVGTYNYDLRILSCLEVLIKEQAASEACVMKIERKKSDSAT